MVRMLSFLCKRSVVLQDRGWKWTSVLCRGCDSTRDLTPVGYQERLQLLHGEDSVLQMHKTVRPRLCLTLKSNMQSKILPQQSATDSQGTFLS